MRFFAQGFLSPMPGRGPLLLVSAALARSFVALGPVALLEGFITKE
ncbi:hypothetical protein HFO52_31025 [Rhizobium leguminosarum]|nr:hypothetical protein [Rhizobium leguminosarum]